MVIKFITKILKHIFNKVKYRITAIKITVFDLTIKIFNIHFKVSMVEFIQEAYFDDRFYQTLGEIYVTESRICIVTLKNYIITHKFYVKLSLKWW